MHGSLGDTDLGVDLLEDSVDIHGEGLDSSSLVALVGSSSSLDLLGSGLGGGGSSG